MYSVFVVRYIQLGERGALKVIRLDEVPSEYVWIGEALGEMMGEHGSFGSPILFLQ